MDNDYKCVESCGHPPFPTRKGLSTHRRTCKKAIAHEHYVDTLSTVANPAEDDEPPTKRLCIARFDTEDDIVRPLSPNPTTPSSPSPPVSHPIRVQPPPPRLTRAQARRLDSAFRSKHDAVPEVPPPLPTPPSTNNSGGSACPPAATARPPHIRDPFRTEPDIFGQYRVYYSRPPKIPDANAPMAHIVPASQNSSTSHSPRPLSDIISPCPNLSVFYVLRYHWLAGNTKSLSDRDYPQAESKFLLSVE